LVRSGALRRQGRDHAEAVVIAEAIARLPDVPIDDLFGVLDRALNELFSISNFSYRPLVDHHNSGPKQSPGANRAAWLFNIASCGGSMEG
jgi:hypothetical protein